MLGVTQRVVQVPGRGTRDCLNQAWGVFFRACNLRYLPLPTLLDEPAEYVARAGIRGIVLSGGNDVPGCCPPGVSGDYAPDRDRLEAELTALCRASRRPILGVCRGMQMLNLFCGGRVRLLEGHAGTAHPLRMLPGSVGLGLPDALEVASHHRYGLLPEDLGEGLLPLALAEDGSVEAFRHASLPLAGLMWHPERADEPQPWAVSLFQAFFGVEKRA
ncbi:MAG: gamma-glutamyl-gamma-aminobutyrate hydrolase family protein [Humidesulfovibrio sp.]|uniref:gamma-glutamyl-gamma-aminobutyrate hydrolase family protein n=1 Tax=Humidesulfovibrio sp. TaxID=2910988 RepID=UPI0027E7326D|nr:gamma-glutamyl-gamma-aminobutyrate hydrolase family protein [Humidesulfovibrio sp.]MDQ7834351.1 gamma-glutamyl-gamma-aminobutyrate hydrolase family protein [Humidesulfovibrio sp.]